MSINTDVKRRPNVGGPGQVLFEFIRYWSKRTTKPSDCNVVQKGRYVLIAEAVAVLSKQGPVTINTLADEIGIDQSGASRLVKQAVHENYLILQPSSVDARQQQVMLSGNGQGLIADAHKWQEEIFLQLTPNWTYEQRQAFRGAMIELMNRSRDI